MRNLRMKALLLTLAMALGLVLELSAGPQRYYQNPVTPSEHADTKYVIGNLARVNNEAKLIGQAISMISAGNRLQHVHPLRFLMCIFSDEEMKANMRNMQRDGLWSKFVSNLSDTFNEEAARGNLLPEQVTHFAQTLKVDSNKYWYLVHTGQWENIVASLINDIPRQGNYRRYDM